LKNPLQTAPVHKCRLANGKHQKACNKIAFGGRLALH
jgi:hypothetical protein